jgi:hypothetical protein
MLENLILKSSEKPLTDKIKSNGFSIELDGENFTVSPSENLTDAQKVFLKANKASIMAELLLTEVFTVWGASIRLNANDAEHQKWLVSVNYSSSTPSKITQEFIHD